MIHALCPIYIYITPPSPTKILCINIMYKIYLPDRKRFTGVNLIIVTLVRLPNR